MDLQTRSTEEQHVPQQPADADRILRQEGMNRQYLLGANKSVQHPTSTPQKMGQPCNVLPGVIPLSATTLSFQPQQQSNQYRSTIDGTDHTRITQPFVTETLQQQMFDVLNLPKPSLTTFDGDQIDFHFFMNSFDACIHAACISDACKVKLSPGPLQGKDTKCHKVMLSDAANSRLQ